MLKMIQQWGQKLHQMIVKIQKFQKLNLKHIPYHT